MSIVVIVRNALKALQVQFHRSMMNDQNTNKHECSFWGIIPFLRHVESNHNQYVRMMFWKQSTHLNYAKQHWSAAEHWHWHSWSSDVMCVLDTQTDKRDRYFWFSLYFDYKIISCSLLVYSKIKTSKFSTVSISKNQVLGWWQINSGLDSIVQWMWIE